MHLCGLQYLPQKRMIITNTAKAELKTWQYTEGEMQVGQEDTIPTKNIPYCILANSDESQLIFHVHDSDYLEAYSFETKKSSVINFSVRFFAGSCLIPLGARGVLAGDTGSKNVYIFKPISGE